MLALQHCLSIGDCATPMPTPAGQVPAQQRYRPPLQTSNHLAVFNLNVRSAANFSESAVPWLRRTLTAQRSLLKGLPCENTTLDELVEIVTWEFAHLAIIHNGPLAAEGSLAEDDTRLSTNLDNGYIQNVVQRYVMGVEPTTKYSLEQGLMQTYLHFPVPKDKAQPTLREANDNNLYLANNMGKLHAGNHDFGSITYVLAASRLRTQLLFTPWDSGAHYASSFAQYCPTSQACSGTLEHFYHVLERHFALLGSAQYSLATIMRLWLSPPQQSQPAPDAFSSYTEIELMGNAYLPESLAYINPLFSKLWGQPYGHKLVTWSQENGRPLIWANGDRSGMLLDPRVGGVNGSYLTPAMAAAWRRLWEMPGLKVKRGTAFAHLRSL